MPPSTTDLKKFAQSARRSLREQVAARLDQVLRTDSAALREREGTRRELSQQIAETSKKAVIDRVAYTWFNRFCALRFMDANRYNRIGVVSPAEGFSQPEILQEAKQGYIDTDLQAFVDCPAVFDLLGGRRPSADPQQEAYRLLLVGMCNALNRAMPFLFEPIADFTELLMPQDLLSEHSILHDLREALTTEACQDVEVIGWLYQFYISERKDEVFEALKQNQKIAPEDIPAATQLFTPHWIVRYLVENSLGRLWMLNRPSSRLVEKMDYYIKPEEVETDFLHVESPEEIKVCDPACGSGHMLTYAFDLLYSIYEEEGYLAADIPRLILEKNLYGIEIDERAGDLAAFALVMKAHGRDRRFFSRVGPDGLPVQPAICVLENITFTDQELEEYAAAMGRDLFTEPLLQTLKQFEQAKNFGSLIRPVLSDTIFLRDELEHKRTGNTLLLYGVHNRVLNALKQAEYLGKRYCVIVTNPPYMGKGMNEHLKVFAKKSFPDSKADLYSMFIERSLDIVHNNGVLGMITMHTWMFLSSFELFRKSLLSQNNIQTLVHLGPRAFDSIGGEVVSTVAFTIAKNPHSKRVGVYFRLTDGESEKEKAGIFLESLQVVDQYKHRRYSLRASEFAKIPGSPISYWVSYKLREIFYSSERLGDILDVRQGMATTDNDRFLRIWAEVSYKDIGFNYSNAIEANKFGINWFPYNKGGNFRKWYGNNYFIVRYENDGQNLIEMVREKYPRISDPEFVIKNRKYYFKPSITWSFIGTLFGVRYSEPGFIFDVGGSSAFIDNNSERLGLTALLCSKLALYFMQPLNPSLNFQVENVQAIPVGRSVINVVETASDPAKTMISLTQIDWNSYEISWNFESLPLLHPKFRNSIVKDTYIKLRNHWRKIIQDVNRLEEENNRIFIEAYGLSNELSPDVPLDQITLTCNPYYRYGGNYSEAELESLLLADTVREFISYAVGCMFGRYSLDQPGLILANQGETLQDYMRLVPAPTFLPDEDNAIPVLDGEWFSDDITERFKKFLRVTFGAEYYEENLAFIESAIGRDIRSYFLKEFYSQHVRMYQKRPIYWMFSSPRGSFNVLIYMHRYQPDTISVILNRFLREFRGKLEGRKAHLEQVSISASSTQREKTAALKEIEGLNKTLEELRVYERDVLYPLAVQGIQIDLDDGVKVNYAKFGKALAKITGLSE